MRRTMGIDAETALRRILEAKGAICIRAAASHGICDVIALGDGEVGLIEVKATRSKKWRTSQKTGTAQRLVMLRGVAERAGVTVYPAVAVWFDVPKVWGLYTPERCLEGPVGPDDSDLDNDELNESTAAPLTSSPYSPPSQDTHGDECGCPLCYVHPEERKIGTDESVRVSRGKE